MIITKIAPAVKTAGRYNIFIDDKYSFSLDEIQLINENLKRGDFIDQDRLNDLQKNSDFGKNYIRAIDLISRRLRSEREIRDYGKRKKWLPENIDRVIERLYEKGYLNDRLFAESFVRFRARNNRYSKKAILLDLLKKGIDRNMSQEIIDLYIDENIIIDNLVAKKYARYQNDIQKLKSYLSRKGFSYDDINKALERFINNNQ